MRYKNNCTFFCSRFAVVLAYNELIYLFEVNQIIWSLLKWQLLKLIAVHRLFQGCEQKQNVVLFNFHNSVKRFWTCKLFLIEKVSYNWHKYTVFDDKYFKGCSWFDLLSQFYSFQLHAMQIDVSCNYCFSLHFRHATGQTCAISRLD